MRSVQNTETCWGNVRQLLSVFSICGNARARSPGPGPGLGFSHWERQLVGNPNFLQEEVGGPLGGLRRGLPLSPPSVVGFPPRRADFPRMIWKVVPSSYRFLLCLAGSLGSGRRHRGAALLGVWLLRPPFCLRPGFFRCVAGPPVNRKRKRTRDHKTGRGFSNTTSPSIFVRSSFSGQGCTDTICIAAPFSLGMLKTSETSGGPAPHPPSQDDVLLANMFRIRCRFSLPHGNTLFQAFRCLAAPGDSPSRLFQPSRLQ